MPRVRYCTLHFIRFNLLCRMIKSRQKNTRKQSGGTLPSSLPVYPERDLSPFTLRAAAIRSRFLRRPTILAAPRPELVVELIDLFEGLLIDGRVPQVRAASSVEHLVPASSGVPGR